MVLLDVTPGRDKPVGQISKTLSITSAVSGSVSFGAVHGMVRGIRVDAPDLTTDTSFTLELQDADGVKLYEWTAVSDNASSWLLPSPEIPSSGEVIVQVTYTTSQSSSWTFYLRYENSTTRV